MIADKNLTDMKTVMKRNGKRSHRLIHKYTMAILNDHLEALDGLFEFVKRGRELSTGYINEIHAALLRHVDTYRAQNQFGEFFRGQAMRSRPVLY